MIDGRPMLLPIKPTGQLSVIAGGDHDRVTRTDVGEVLSRGLPGSSAAMVVRGADVAWQWELPGGRAFGGAALPVQLGEALWFTQYVAVIADQRLRPLNEFVSSASRGVVIASTLSEFGTSHVLLDVIAARQQIRDHMATIPQAFLADDLTLGIMWVLSNRDEALLNSDGVLARVR